MRKKRIVFYVTDTEYKQLEKEARVCSISINVLVKGKTLEEEDIVRIKRGAALTMAQLYSWTDRVEDLAAREYLKKRGDQLCQCLK